MKFKFVALMVATTIAHVHAQTLPGGFVYLRDIDPTIIQNVRCATSNNFIGRPINGDAAGIGETETVAQDARLLPAGAGERRYGQVVA